MVGEYPGETWNTYNNQNENAINTSRSLENVSAEMLG